MQSRCGIHTTIGLGDVDRKASTNVGCCVGSLDCSSGRRVEGRCINGSCVNAGDWHCCRRVYRPSCVVCWGVHGQLSSEI